MYSSARCTAVSNSLRNPVSRSTSERDVEAGERTPLLTTKSNYEPNQANRTPLPTTAVLGILTLVMLLVFGVIIAGYLLSNQVPSPWPISHPFYMVERNVWWKQQAAELNPLDKSATQNVILLHTRSEPCLDQATCIQVVQQLEHNAWTENGTHIPYNFLIGGDGKTYEARGWKAQHGFHRLPGLNDTIVVGIIGTYNDGRPDKVMYDETKALFTESIRRFSLSPHYRLYGVSGGSIPENNIAALYEEVKEWKHWSGFVTI